MSFKLLASSLSSQLRSRAPRAAAVVSAALLLALLVLANGIHWSEARLRGKPAIITDKALDVAGLDAFNFEICGQSSVPVAPVKEVEIPLGSRSGTHRLSRFGRSPEEPKRGPRRKKPRSSGNEPRSNVKQRIWGGYPVSQTEFPWYVSIIASFGWNDTRINIPCGGTLIHEDLVLSSASCLSHPIYGHSEEMVVVVGQETDQFSVSFKVIKTKRGCIGRGIKVWDENEKGPGYDLSVIKLAEKVAYTNYARPICLRRRSAPRLNYEHCATVGTEEVKPNLKDVASIKKLPMRPCTGLEMERVKARQDQICYTTDTKKGVTGSPCWADFGNGLYCKDEFTNTSYLAAIQSVNTNACIGNQTIPTLFTDLSATFNIEKMLANC